MGVTSKVREGYKERLSAKAAERQRRRPGVREDRRDLVGVADNRRELAFAAVMALVGLVALYFYLQNHKGRGASF